MKMREKQGRSDGDEEETGGERGRQGRSMCGRREMPMGREGKAGRREGDEEEASGEGDKGEACVEGGR